MAFSNAVSLSNAGEYFKRVYARANLVPITVRETVTLKNITMQEHAYGEVIVEPIVTEMPVGASATASMAVTNAYGSRTKAWQFTPKSFYAAVNVPALDQALSEKNEAAYLSLKKQEMDNKLIYMGQRFESMLWSDGSGALGQVVSIDDNDPDYTITVSGGAAIFFHKNQFLTFNSASSGGTNRNFVGQVTAVDDYNDTITITRTDGVTSVVQDDDYIFVQGDHGALNAAASDLMITGIPAYIPAYTPGTNGVPATLNNVDRTERPNLLAGWRGANEGSIVASTKALVARMGRYAKIAPKTALMLSFNNWKRLEEELGDKAWRDQSAEAMFGTGAIMVLTPKGKIPAIAVPALGDSACFLGDLASVKLRHVKAFPHLRQDGGVSSVRLDWGNDQDGERFEFRAWGEVAVNDPGSWGRFPVTPAV